MGEHETLQVINKISDLPQNQEPHCYAEQQNEITPHAYVMYKKGEIRYSVCICTAKVILQQQLL